MIEAPPSPHLVVAGAGSGKTETMAGPGGVAGRERSGRRRPGARPDLHPQGGGRAGGPDRPAAARSGAARGRADAAGRRSRPRSPPTTRTPRRWWPTTACGSGSSRGRGCSARRRAGSWRTTSWSRGTPTCASGQRLAALDLGSTGWSPRCCRWPASAPSTCSIRTTSSACSTTSTGAISGLPKDGDAAARRCRRKSATSPRCSRSVQQRRRPGAGASQAYLRRKRELETLDFGDQVRMGRSWRALPDVAAGRAGAVRRRAARRVPGHVARTALAAQVALRRRARGDGGRRPAPVDLRLARCQRGQPRPLPVGTSRSRTAARRPCSPSARHGATTGPPSTSANTVSRRCASAPRCPSPALVPRPEPETGVVEVGWHGHAGRRGGGGRRAGIAQLRKERHPADGRACCAGSAGSSRCWRTPFGPRGSGGGRGSRGPARPPGGGRRDRHAAGRCTTRRGATPWCA